MQNMPGWPVSRLEDVAEIGSGITVGRKLNGEHTFRVPYLRVANVQAGFLDLTEIKEIDVKSDEFERFQLQPGDVLMTEGGDRDKLGRGAIWDGRIPSCIHQNHLFRVRVDQNKLLPEFFHYFLISSEAKDYFLRCAKQTTGIATINRSQLGLLPIKLPPLTVQRHITTVLHQAESLRMKRAEAIRLANELVPSVFQEMFGNELADSRQQTLLELVAEIGSGIMKGRKFNGQATVELPYLRVANVQAGYLDLSEMKTIAVPVSEVDRYRLQHHDIVLTEGGDFDKLGRGALWESQVDDCVHQNHIFRVRCDQRRLLPLYFATYLQSQPAITYFLRCAKKTTNLATINMTQLRQLPVHLPPPSQQKEFADRLVELWAISQCQDCSRVELDNLFHTLLQRAFRGEL